MSAIFKLVMSWIIVAALTAFLTACGSGSGDGSYNGSSGGGTAVSITDPAPAYKGVAVQAVVNQGNAEALTMGGFGGSSIGLTFGTRTLRKTTDAATGDDLLIRQLTLVIKKSAWQMDISGLAQRRMKMGRTSGKAKVIARATTFDIPGAGGGKASYSMDVDDASGSFSGSVVYYDYSSNGITISGKADIFGTLDVNRQVTTRLTLSFSSLSLTNGQVKITLMGSLSWGFNVTASSDTMTMNMVITDQADGKTYWFKDYEIITIYGDGALTQKISGRYFDPDHGYVDFSTSTNLLAYYGNAWPSQGTLKFTGKSGRSASLSFLPRNLLIEADVDGNGTVDWQTQRPTNTQSDHNTPPIADAGSDKNVVQGATVSLDASASRDPDGDALSYSWAFDSCPQYTCPGITGSNTTAPSFIADLPGNYTLRLTVFDGQAASSPDNVTVTSSPALSSDPNLLQMQWQYGIYGTNIGRTGLLLSDLDGDGKPEIIASGANSSWYVLRRTADATYEQMWRSENYAVPIVRLALADANGDGRDDVVVGLSDGTIRIHDGATLQAAKTIKAANPLTSMAVTDLDGDGKPEIITSNGIGVFVYSAETGGLKWSLPNGGGTSIAVGNVDDDPVLEIVTTTYGGKGYVIDSVSRAIEWEYVNGFGSQVALGDVDGDGMQEIVGSYGRAKITIFDADRKTPAWEIATAEYIDSLLVVDTDGDGVPEIIYADGQYCKIHAFDGRTHSQKWVLDHSDDGVSGLAVGDVDLDGKTELVFGAGGWSTGPDHLYVVDLATGTTKWQSTDIQSPLSAVAVADVNDDGQNEIVMISGGSDGDRFMNIFNARTHALEYQGKLNTHAYSGLSSVSIGDVDGDGRTEVTVTISNSYDGLIQVYDGTTHALKLQSAKYQFQTFSALATGDVDNDGKTEIVAALGNYLVVFDGATLLEKWRSVSLGDVWDGVHAIKLVDVDGDGHPDIVAAVSGNELNGNRLVVFDGVTRELKLMIAHPARALEVADIDGDNVREILVGKEKGEIDVFDGKTFSLKKTVSTFSADPVDAIRVEDLDGDGSGEWIVARGGVLVVLHGQNQGLKWRSSNLSGGLGYYNHLAVRDTNGDGRKEIFVGSNSNVYQFE